MPYSTCNELHVVTPVQVTPAAVSPLPACCEQVWVNGLGKKRHAGCYIFFVICWLYNSHELLRPWSAVFVLQQRLALSGISTSAILGWDRNVLCQTTTVAHPAKWSWLLSTFPVARWKWRHGLVQYQGKVESSRPITTFARSISQTVKWRRNQGDLGGDVSVDKPTTRWRAVTISALSQLPVSCSQKKRENKSQLDLAWSAESMQRQRHWWLMTQICSLLATLRKMRWCILSPPFAMSLMPWTISKQWHMCGGKTKNDTVPIVLVMTKPVEPELLNNYKFCIPKKILCR